MSCSPITDARLVRLQAQLDAIDGAIDSLTGGAVEVEIGAGANRKRYRYSERHLLENQKTRIEASISKLQALKMGGGQTLIRRGCA